VRIKPVRDTQDREEVNQLIQRLWAEIQRLRERVERLEKEARRRR
jgi:hypothetical protein